MLAYLFLQSASLAFSKIKWFIILSVCFTIVTNGPWGETPFEWPYCPYYDPTLPPLKTYLNIFSELLRHVMYFSTKIPTPLTLLLSQGNWFETFNLLWPFLWLLVKVCSRLAQVCLATSHRMDKVSQCGCPRSLDYKKNLVFEPTFCATRQVSLSPLSLPAEALADGVCVCVCVYSSLVWSTAFQCVSVTFLDRSYVKWAEETYMTFIYYPTTYRTINGASCSPIKLKISTKCLFKVLKQSCFPADILSAQHKNTGVIKDRKDGHPLCIVPPALECGTVWRRAALRGMAEVNLGLKKSTWIISNHVFFPLQVYFHNYLQAIPYFFLC